MSFYQLLKLQWQKTVRSVSASRKLVSSILLGIFAGIGLLYVLSIGFALKYVITNVMGRQDVAVVVSSFIIYFYLIEMMYRYFLQKMSTLELGHYLHLPVGRPKLIHFVLSKSFISVFNLIIILLVAPVCFMQVIGAYGTVAGLSWLFTIIFISWTIHWLMVWFEQKFGDSMAGILIIFVILLIGAGSAWYGWFDIGMWVGPFFTAALHNPFSLITAFLLMSGAYLLAYRFYYRHAYLEELGPSGQTRVIGDNLSLFGQFGLAGAIADLELKLVLRHRRSKMALILSAFFLLYGLLEYTQDINSFSSGVPFLAVFIGTFITGIFILQYGQLFLSWNSSYFDFYFDRRKGIRALVEGKYLLFFGVSTAAYLLSIPYVYFGWPVLLVQTVTFLFNIGINMHIIIYMALWKPKPVDLSKRSAFNYEGVGAAQFLMAIPMLGLPYLIYWPIAHFFNDITGLLVLGFVGILGILFYNQFVTMQVNRILNTKYAIASSFRQEL